MQQIRMLLKQEMRNNKNDARVLKKIGGNFILKLARDRDRDSKDTTRTSAMKRSDGTLVTGVKQVIDI